MSFVAIGFGLALACLAGWCLNRRAGVLRELPAGAPSDDAGSDAEYLGLEPGRPAVVHFSAPWCGPCAGLRRVVDQVCAELGDVAHKEIDIDDDPAAARRFSVLSLPTTLIFDTEGAQRFRAAGVPAAADLRSALKPLLA